MKHTEIMIGNLIAIHDGRTMRVVSLRGGYVFGAVDGYVGAIGEIYQRCQPIPITDELLLKNGFDEPFYRTDTKCSTHVRSLENGCELWARFHVPRKYWYLDVVNEDAFILSSGKVDYLHQLQNLCNIAGVEMEWKV